MIDIKTDWRFRIQDRYLRNKTFSFKKYNQPYPEHDHCDFCWIKFGTGGEIQEGYTDEDDYHWICPQCFEDFKYWLLGEWNCKLAEAKQD